MKALFLAGGMGKRLRPLTNEIPKPMVPIMGKPLLERNMKNLKDNGISEIVISTCYKPYHIREYFGDGRQLGLKIQYVLEDIPLGTGGAIKNTEEFFDDTFIVFNSDILCDISIKDLIRYHRSKSAVATIAVTEVENPSLYGVIEYDENNYVLSFTEKPDPAEIKSNYINAGIYVLEPEMLKEIPEGRAVSIEREVYPSMLEEGIKIAIYKGGSYWMDIGTPEKYIQAHRDIMNARCEIPECNYKKTRIFTEKNIKIHPSSRIKGPAYIGKNAEISANCVIGPNTIIGKNSFIGKGSKVVDSIVWDNVYVESGARLFNTIVASDCKIGRNTEYYNLIYTKDVNQPIAI